MIISSDDRPIEKNLLTALYPSLSAVVQYLYAARHNYMYLYYRFPVCWHSRKGYLSPTWCKVLAVYHAMLTLPENSMVVYIDSDAIIQLHSMPFDIFLENATSLASPHLGPLNTASIIFSDNWPFDDVDEVCPGFFIVVNNVLSRHILQRWWNFNEQPTWNSRRPHEMGAANVGILRWDFGIYRPYIAAFRTHMFRDLGANQFIRHVGTAENARYKVKNKVYKRQVGFLNFLTNLSITPELFRQKVNLIRRSFYRNIKLPALRNLTLALEYANYVNPLPISANELNRTLTLSDILQLKREKRIRP